MKILVVSLETVVFPNLPDLPDFQNEPNVKAKHWGWQKALSLISACRDVAGQYICNKGGLSKEIHAPHEALFNKKFELKNFAALNVFFGKMGKKGNVTFSWVEIVGEEERLYFNDDFFNKSILADSEIYVPAQWGNNVLKLAKKGIISVYVKEKGMYGMDYLGNSSFIE
ncbi:MAG: hypothetical protein WCP15_03255 [bacterium]